MKIVLAAIMMLGTALSAEVTMTKFVGFPGFNATTNPTHYGNPSGGCMTDEQAVQVQGVDGDFCSPVCKDMRCPQDVPSGVSAKPQCALQTGDGSKYCALICDPSDSGSCGSGSCQSIQGIGLCTYSA